MGKFFSFIHFQSNCAVVYNEFYYRNVKVKYIRFRKTILQMKTELGWKEFQAHNR